MLSAFAQAARVSAPDRHGTYLDVATRNAEFVLTFLRPDTELRRAWRADKASNEVFLEDYAALICGLLDLYETDFDNRWFAAALELGENMLARFADPSGGFFDTPSEREGVPGQTPLLFRPKDLQDSATPSGNSLACDALLRLAAFTDRADFRQQAEGMLGLITEPALRYPTAFGRWLQAADLALGGPKQVALVGDLGRAETQTLLAEIRRTYRPRVITAASPLPLQEAAPPLLRDRPLIGGMPTAYVCEGFVCKLPVSTAETLRDLLEPSGQA
jgi:uncharacterized protein YyaL (SSP411 family)